jgi:hypothetical protein
LHMTVSSMFCVFQWSRISAAFSSCSAVEIVRSYAVLY